MKKSILSIMLCIPGATVCMLTNNQSQTSQRPSTQERGQIDFRLLKLYLKTVTTKRSMAKIFVDMPEKVSELSDEQLLLKKNLLKDYTRVNNLQRIILDNIQISGLNIDDNKGIDSDKIKDLMKKNYGDDALYQTSLARSDRV